MSDRSLRPKETRSTISNKASKKASDRWHTLTNSQEQKLHILKPNIYTEDELKWLQLRHESGYGQLTGLTVAPREPRTTAVERMLLLIALQHEQRPDGLFPMFYVHDVHRLHAEWSLKEGFYHGTLVDAFRSMQQEPELQWSPQLQDTAGMAKNSNTGVHGHPWPRVIGDGSQQWPFEL